ncbi:MAG: hypothetical protein JWO48_2203 [Bryobacterales bacterium]|nr:hypothetical protein [Bryobacterales bacterium]
MSDAVGIHEAYQLGDLDALTTLLGNPPEALCRPGALHGLSSESSESRIEVRALLLVQGDQRGSGEPPHTGLPVVYFLVCEAVRRPRNSFESSRLNLAATVDAPAIGAVFYAA